MLLKYYCTSLNKVYFKKTIFLYYYSLYNFFFKLKIFSLVTKRFYNLSSKFSYLFFLLIFFFFKYKFKHFLLYNFFFFKKFILFEKINLNNSDSISYSIKNKTCNITNFNFLRSFFIYKKAVEQYSIKQNMYLLSVRSFFFYHFFNFGNNIENVNLKVNLIVTKTFKYHIK